MTGSRNWKDKDAVWEALDGLLPDENLLVVHGDCPNGADALADRWAFANRVPVERHGADWSAYGLSAGPRRNAEMVASGADLCLAFIKGYSKGASHTAGLAKKAGIPVRYYRED